MARRKKQNDDESKENQENSDSLNENINHDSSDDTFGLPEVEYEPINRDEPIEEASEPIEEPVYERSDYEHREEAVPDFDPREEPVHQEDVYQSHADDEPTEFHSRYAYMEESSQSVWPKVLLVLLIILLAGSAVYYFAYYRPEKEREEVAEREYREKQERDAQAERDRFAELRRAEEEANQRRADSLANIPKEGSIERLAGRTGQYWVVVASAIDDDLLMDFAQKLSKDGKQVKIIPPFGKQGKFHRLAVDSRDNYPDAQAAADGMKGGEFGDQLWVVKY